MPLLLNEVHRYVGAVCPRSLRARSFYCLQKEHVLQGDGALCFVVDWSAFLLGAGSLWFGESSCREVEFLAMFQRQRLFWLRFSCLTDSGSMVNATLACREDLIPSSLAGLPWWFRLSVKDPADHADTLVFGTIGGVPIRTRHEG